MKPKHFHNLDGLRFFASLLVMLKHVEYSKKFLNIPSLADNQFYDAAGIAVTFFFVLSGFLITYNLVTEQQQKAVLNERIDIKRFYKKRTARILPLYYLLVLLVFLVLPFVPLFQVNGYKDFYVVDHAKNFMFFMLMVPNVVIERTLYLGQTWTIGAEEFFYFIFPLILFFKKPRHYLSFFLVLLTIGFLGAWFSERVPYNNFQNNRILYVTIRFLIAYIPYLFIFLSGSVAAILYLWVKEKAVVIKYSKHLKALSVGILVAICVFVRYSYLMPENDWKTYLMPLVFSAAIFILCVSDVKILLLNFPPILYLGKISYGLYMLHPLVIVVLLKTLPINWGNTFLDTLLLDLLALVATTVLAAIVYRYFELPFIKMARKKQTTNVVTT